MKRLTYLLFFFCMACAEAQQTQIIFRGDDMGFSHSCNVACIDAYQKGLVRTVEVIANGPWFEEAVQLLAANPGLDVGVHLALTSEWANLKWRPLTSAPSLVDENGYFFPMIWPNDNYPKAALLNQNWDINEVEAELRAQIELVQRRIPRVSHLTAHMGCTRINDDTKALMSRLAEEYGLDIAPGDFGFEALPSWQGKQYNAEEKEERLLTILDTLQPGKYLSVVHPAYLTAETEEVHHIGYENVGEDRDAEMQALTSERVLRAIEEKNIQVIGYHQVVSQ